jgi:hypothetical protein
MYIPDPVLRNPSDICAYLTMFFLQNTVFSEGTSNKTGMHLSFQTLAAKYTEPGVLASHCAMDLKKAIVRCVPGSDPEVICAVEKDEVARTFKISLSIMDVAGNSLLRRTMFSIDKDGAITVNYNQ